MFCTVYVLLLLALPAGWVAHPLTERLDPRSATWLLTATAATLAAASSAGLLLLALTGLLRTHTAAALGHWSLRVLRNGTPGTGLVSPLAGAALVTAAVATAGTLRCRVRAQRTAAREAARLPTRHGLSVAEDPSAEAFAVPGSTTSAGPGGRVVVSTGMLAALTPEEVSVLVAHERAHLHARHHWFVMTAQLAATANPLLRPLARHVSYTVERWADEEAALATGDRRRVARTIGKAALARQRTAVRTSAPHGVLRLTGPSASAGPVPRRVAALLAPPHRGVRAQPLVPALTTLLVATALLCCADAAHDVHRLLQLAHESTGY
ncbi:M56 family metallopeptidase [Streptomyces sp. NPDC048665]|uniref:M56 family metallopeptidase n=1 Tax=Streptomyces sp. NPDC048665 TaxID=3155490 RepID=UPI0034396782